MATFRLTSNAMVHAPGMIAWAMNGYHFEDDRPALLKVISNIYPDVASNHLHDLLKGDLHHEIEGDAVVFVTRD